MRDIEKLNMSHDADTRRIRRRRRGRSLYALLGIILTFAIIITLSMTIFFNIKTIRVTGDAEYTPEEIVEAVGVSKGDNMMRIHLDEQETKAEELLINAERVDIQRQFPSTLVIDVQKAIPAYNVSYEEGTLIVSEQNKILRNSMDPVEGLISITGYEPEETTPGKRLSAKEERQEKIFSSFQEILQEMDLTVPIAAIDISDLNNIQVSFDHRIEFSMGNWSEIPYKIRFAEQVIAEQPEGKEGYLTMIGTNQCSFRNKSDVENAEKAAEWKAAAQQEALTENMPENSETVAVLPESAEQVE